MRRATLIYGLPSVSYTHLRAHETKANLVCRLNFDIKTLRGAQHTVFMSYIRIPGGQAIQCVKRVSRIVYRVNFEIKALRGAQHLYTVSHGQAI